MITHVSKTGSPNMVDISDKQPTLRRARAQARLYVNDEIENLLRAENLNSPKGPVFDTAILAGIMACKRTPELIPLCHHVALQDCNINIQFSGQKEILIECEVKTVDRTGVEMEALTGASVAALTVYDMCKGISQDIEISGIRLIEKKGGKSDFGNGE
ncbi:MAG: cyclic pyranopterin monophosphate synthase MoaC [Gammaproteobacteria bacterium]